MRILNRVGTHPFLAEEALYSVTSIHLSTRIASKDRAENLPFAQYHALNLKTRSLARASTRKLPSIKPI